MSEAVADFIIVAVDDYFRSNFEPWQQLTTEDVDLLCDSTALRSRLLSVVSPPADTGKET